MGTAVAAARTPPYAFRRRHAGLAHSQSPGGWARPAARKTTPMVEKAAGPMFVMEEVRILKRGQAIRLSGDPSDEDVFSPTRRLGPEPGNLPTDHHLRTDSPGRDLPKDDHLCTDSPGRDTPKDDQLRTDSPGCDPPKDHHLRTDSTGCDPPKDDHHLRTDSPGCDPPKDDHYLRTDSPRCYPPKDHLLRTDSPEKPAPLTCLYAGAGFISSPSPSSVPFPISIFPKENSHLTTKGRLTTKGLRFLLRLDVA